MKIMGYDLYAKIKECVRLEQEKRGRENPIPLDEIAFKLQISEVQLIQLLAFKADRGGLAGMTLFIRIND